MRHSHFHLSIGTSTVITVKSVIDLGAEFALTETHLTTPFKKKNIEGQDRMIKIVKVFKSTKCVIINSNNLKL